MLTKGDKVSVLDDAINGVVLSVQGQEVTIGLLQNNIVTVPEQQFETFNYRGSGTFNTSTNTYTFRFSVDDLPTYIDSCVVTTVKQ